MHPPGQIKKFSLGGFTGKVVSAPPRQRVHPQGRASVQCFEKIGKMWTVGEVILVVSACV